MVDGSGGKAVVLDSSAQQWCSIVAMMDNYEVAGAKGRTHTIYSNVGKGRQHLMVAMDDNGHWHLTVAMDDGNCNGI
jgi:hypothetical protein